MERFRGAAGTDDGYGAVVENASHDRLVHVDRLYLREIHLEGTPCNKTLLDDNPAVCDDKLR